MSTNVLFEKLVGNWTGTCKIWFDPKNLADESEVKSAYSLILGDRFLKHAYSGSIQGKPRWGWRTELELLFDDQLLIKAYNFRPEGKEDRAIETLYRRT